MSKKHRIVVIGHRIISHAYLQAIRAHENAEIAGVIRRDSERVRAYANEHEYLYSVPIWLMWRSEPKRQQRSSAPRMRFTMKE